jgi:hypothetical protein
MEFSMTFKHVAHALIFGGCLSTFIACSGEEGDGNKNQPAGVFPTVAACDLTFANLPSMPAVSFSKDVMPIFGLSCAANSCHNTEDRKAGIYLGPKCSYDAAAPPWMCTYPAAADGMGAGPLTPEIIAEVYANLMANSVTAPTVKRVTPGDPMNSFLIDKLGDLQNTGKPYQASCQPQETGMGACGAGMPRGGPFCPGTGTFPTRFTAVAAWVQQGAPNN